MGDTAKTSKTIYVGGLPPSVDEEVLVSTFSCFGEILDVQMPRDGGRRRQDDDTQQGGQIASGNHRGFGFLVFSTDQEAHDAIDNMHLNELHGKILSVNIAKPLKASTNASGFNNRPIWEDEEWIQKYAKPLGQDEAGEEGAATTEGNAVDGESS